MKAHKIQEFRQWSSNASSKTHAGGAHDHGAMLRELRAPWLWTNATVMALGLG